MLKKNKKLTEVKKMRLEDNYLPVESRCFDGLIYAVDRQGKGIHVISGSRSIGLDAEDIEPFVRELEEVWKVMRPVMNV
jgi:hypothetical protein